MKKKIANSFKHILTAAGKNWMEAMRYYSLQMLVYSHLSIAQGICLQNISLVFL